MSVEIDLSGRVAIVTGGSRGLGRADALTLERAGAEVVVLDVEEANTTIVCDVADRAQVDEAVKRVVDEHGSVAILVNNAGALDHLGRFPDQQSKLWERDLRVNLTGAFNCAQAVWPYMQERGWGRIVNMASVAGTLGGFGQASYSTTKAGLLGLTRTLALEGARHGITCNAIVPGVIGTEAFEFVAPEMKERM
ncbi:MAG TPA: SDR family NAD(P)-dependent oxidoreductase, partial [Gaiellaceae bacterium]|nr:SDR family NAD(P)-dependent oxidoreductase [Gaiellaceae bacterium]